MTTDLLKNFARLFIGYQVRDEAPQLLCDATHGIDIDELSNGNVRLYAKTLIKGHWLPLTSIEIETYTPHFWFYTAEALLVLGNVPRPNGAVPLLVQRILDGMPAAATLTVERDRPPVPSFRKRKKRQPTTGTVRSEQRTIAKF